MPRMFSKHWRFIGRPNIVCRESIFSNTRVTNCGQARQNGAQWWSPPGLQPWGRVGASCLCAAQILRASPRCRRSAWIYGYRANNANW
jgi:hypothetical protein